MTTISEFTQREEQLVALLTQHFPDNVLDARIVNVNKLEGGEEATLRFTLDDVSSTDLSRERIAAGHEPVETLADEAAEELRNPGEPIGP